MRLFVDLWMRFDKGLLHVVHVYPLHPKHELGMGYAPIFVSTFGN